MSKTGLLKLKTLITLTANRAGLTTEELSVKINENYIQTLAMLIQMSDENEVEYVENDGKWVVVF